MKRRFLIILCFTLISCCSMQHPEMVGTYESEELHLLEKAWKYGIEGYDGFIIGTELQLKEDHSFIMTSCGNRLTGRWHAAGDTLNLHYETNEWRNDSVQNSGLQGKWPTVPTSTEIALIRKHKLIFSWASHSGDKIYHVLEKTKVKDTETRSDDQKVSHE